MTPIQKIKCKAIAQQIKLGKYGAYNVDTEEEILNKVREEYNTTQEMEDYIVVLLNENEKLIYCEGMKRNIILGS